MSFKFAVGQTVEYKPAQGTVDLFTVIQQMPEEFKAIDRKYRIKSVQEGFERIVMECDLTATDKPEKMYAVQAPNRRSGGR